MAVIGNIVIGLSASTGPFVKQMEKGRSAILSLGGATQGIGGMLLRFGAALGAGLAIKKAITGASELNETISKVRAIMGDAAPAAEAFADSMASRFGLVRKEVLDATAAFAGIGKGLGGLSGAALADFSTSTAKLAADLTSFANIDFGEAQSAILTGLSGEQSDTLKKLGVTLLDSQVKAEAYASGIAKAGTELTNAQKVAARTQLIFKGLADAQGDLDRTADSTSNQLRAVQGRVANLGADLGQALLPAVNIGLKLVSDLVAGIGEGFNRAGALIASWSTSSSATLSGWGINLSTIVEDIGYAFRNLPDFLAIAAIKVQEFFINTGEWIGALGTNLANFGNWLVNNWTKLIADAFNAVTSYFQNLATNLADLGSNLIAFLKNPTQGVQFNWTPLLKGFEATAAELPALVAPQLTDLSGAIDAKLAEIGQREADRAKGLQQAAAGAAGPGGGAGVAAGAGVAVAPKQLLAGALERGSIEARSADLKHSLGLGKDDATRATAGNTAQIASTSRAMLGALNQIVAATAGGAAISLPEAAI